MPVEPEIMANARKWIGHKSAPRTELVTTKDIRRFAISIGDKNPLFRDAEYAKKLGYKDLIAPYTFHLAHNLPDDELDNLFENGVGPKMGARFEVPVPGYNGAVAAGRDIEHVQPIYPGDTLTAEETVVEIYEKDGRMGPMIFIVSEHMYRNQRGEPVTIERQTTIRHK